MTNQADHQSCAVIRTQCDYIKEYLRAVRGNLNEIDRSFAAMQLRSQGFNLTRTEVRDRWRYALKNIEDAEANVRGMLERVEKLDPGK